jgi:hypothetical protein
MSKHEFGRRETRTFTVVLVAVLAASLVLVAGSPPVSADSQSFNPSNYNLLENTKYVSGAVGDLASNDGTNYMKFRSYPSVFSSDVLVAENEGVATYAAVANSYQDRVTLTWTPSVADNWLIIATAKLHRSSTTATRTTKAQLTIDGTSVAETYCSDDITANDNRTFVAIKVDNFTAVSHTLKIQYATTNTNNIARIDNARLIAIRIGDNNFYENENLKGGTTSSKTYVGVENLTFTPDITDNYLVFARVDVTNATITNFTGVRLTIDGENKGEENLKISDASAYLPAAFQMGTTLTGGTSHTIQISVVSPSNTVITYKNALLYAIRNTEIFRETFFIDNTTVGSTTSLTPVVSTTLNFTPCAVGDYLIFATGELRTSSLTVPVNASLTVDGTLIENSSIDWITTLGQWTSFAYSKRLTSLSASAHTTVINFYAAVAGTAYIRNARILVLRLPAASAFAESVEFTGTSNTLTWDNITWTVDSQWTTDGVSVILQLYNYHTGGYPTSGDGYINYTSGAANTDQTPTQTISTNPTYFRDALGNWKVKVSGAKTTTTQFDLKVDWVEFKPSAPTPTVTTSAATSVGSTTATLNGDVTSDGGVAITERGFYCDTSSSPTTKYTVSGTTGAYTKNMTGLSPGTIYYFKAYATNSVGTSYGSILNFTTSVGAPTVTTQAAAAVEENTATGRGNIMAIGVANPTVRGFKYGLTQMDNWSVSESGYFGTGTYNLGLTGLSPGTLYYIRAFATNSGGTDYGSYENFRTKPYPPPSLTATAVSYSQINLSWTKGTGAWKTKIIRKPGSAPSGRTDTAAVLVYDNTDNSYNDIMGLNPSTTYYYRAWSYTDSPQQLSDVPDVTAYDTTPLAVTATATGPTGSTKNSSVLLTYTYMDSPTSVKIYYTNNTSSPYTWTQAVNDTTVNGSESYTIPSDGTYGWNAVAIGGTETDPPLSSTPPEASWLILDTIAPTVSNVTSTKANGTYGVGENIPVTVTFSESVNVDTSGGTPYITLETGTKDRNARYDSGSGSATLIFKYMVQAGDNSSDLDYTSTTALKENYGEIKDSAGNAATLTLPIPSYPGSLGYNKDIVIATTAPTVTVTPTGTSTNSSPITFTMTFSKSVTGLTVAGITVTNGTKGTLSGSGTTYTIPVTPTAQGAVTCQVIAGAAHDAAGNNNTASNTATVTYDTIVPTVSNVTSTAVNGAYTVNQVIPVTVTFLEFVYVTGTPQLTLATGGAGTAVNCTGGSGTATLTFNYTVAAGDNSADLDYVDNNSLKLNDGTIKDNAGNDATLTLSTPGTAGSLGYNKAIVIDTRPGQPQLVYPDDGAVISDSMPTLLWTVGGNADNHRLLVYNDSNFSSPEENELLGAGDDIYTLSTSLPDGNYSWKVIAINVSGETESAVRTFRVIAIPTIPGWWGLHWVCRRPITINDSHPKNYQIKIVIPYDDDMRSDYGDLRFTESENRGELSYWVENYTGHTVGTDNATVWVRRIENSDNTIYVYYCNPGATSISNGASTFIAFDNFEDGNVSDWSGTMTVAASMEQRFEGSYSMKKTSAAGNQYKYKSIAVDNAEVWLWQRITNDPSAQGGPLFRSNGSTGYYTSYIYYVDDTSRQIDLRRYTSVLASSSNFAVSPGSWYKLVLRGYGTSISAEVFDNTYKSLASVSVTDTSYSSGYVGWHMYDTSAYCDLLVARKYVPPDPATSVGAEDRLSGGARNLMVDGQVSPQRLTNLTPELSFCYLDNEGEDNSGRFHIQVGRSKGDNSLWDNWQAKNVKHGATIAITYAGENLHRGFQQYYWRVRMRDNKNNWSDWSDNENFRLNLVPFVVNQRTQGLINPTRVATLNPTLSWGYFDLDGDVQTQRQIQVGTSENANDMWDSTVSTSATSAKYDGLPLSMSVVYSWKVRVYDYEWSNWCYGGTFEIELMTLSAQDWSQDVHDHQAAVAFDALPSGYMVNLDSSLLRSGAAAPDYWRLNGGDPDHTFNYAREEAKSWLSLARDNYRDNNYDMAVYAMGVAAHYIGDAMTLPHNDNIWASANASLQYPSGWSLRRHFEEQMKYYVPATPSPKKWRPTLDDYIKNYMLPYLDNYANRVQNDWSNWLSRRNSDRYVESASDNAAQLIYDAWYSLLYQYMGYAGGGGGTGTALQGRASALDGGAVEAQWSFGLLSFGFGAALFFAAVIFTRKSSPEINRRRHSLRKDKRGISSVVGGILVLSIVFVAGAVLVTHWIPELELKNEMDHTDAALDTWRNLQQAILNHENVKIEVNMAADPASILGLMEQAPSPGTITVTLAKYVMRILPDDDAYVGEENSLSSDNLWVQSYKDNNRRAYLKFNMENLPVDAKIYEARLVMYAKISSFQHTWENENGYSPVSMLVSVMAVDNDNWSEGAIRWNNNPGYDNVLLNEDLPSENTWEIAYDEDVQNENVGMWYTFNVSSYVNGQRAGNDNLISLCLKAPRENSSFKRYAWFRSKESAGYRPYLQITYESASEDWRSYDNWDSWGSIADSGSVVFDVPNKRYDRYSFIFESGALIKDRYRENPISVTDQGGNQITQQPSPYTGGPILIANPPLVVGQQLSGDNVQIYVNRYRIMNRATYTGIGKAYLNITVRENTDLRMEYNLDNLMVAVRSDYPQVWVGSDPLLGGGYLTDIAGTTRGEVGSLDSLLGAGSSDWGDIGVRDFYANAITIYGRRLSAGTEDIKYVEHVYDVWIDITAA